MIIDQHYFGGRGGINVSNSILGKTAALGSTSITFIILLDHFFNALPFISISDPLVFHVGKGLFFKLNMWLFLVDFASFSFYYFTSS